MGLKEFSRTDRVGEQLRRELAEILVTESADPRFSRVTVTGVKVSRDLAHATVRVTVPQEMDPGKVVAALQRAAGYFRRALARRVRMRSLPALRFAHDRALEDALRLSSLIDEAAGSRAVEESDG